MESKLWVELQCLTCLCRDRLPLWQYLTYSGYKCPYEGRDGKCTGDMKLLKIRLLQFKSTKQLQLC